MTNKYEKWYNALIEKRRKYPLTKNNTSLYVESHHIIPRSVGGSNESSNIINLTLREHVIAHKLLLKIYEHEYGKTSSEYYSMLRALFWMLNTKKQKLLHYSSKFYEATRSKFIQMQRERMKGEGNPMYGKPCTYAMTSEEKEKWLNKHRGENHQFYGKKRPDQSIRMSGSGNPMYGKPCTDFMTEEEIKLWHENKSKTRQGENNSFYGKHHSEETKQKIRESQQKWLKEHGGHGPNYGKKISKEASEHLSKLRKGKKFSKESLKKTTITRMYKRFGNEYNLSEFDFDLYITLKGTPRRKYREEYFKLHKKSNP